MTTGSRGRRATTRHSDGLGGPSYILSNFSRSRAQAAFSVFTVARGTSPRYDVVPRHGVWQQAK